VPRNRGKNITLIAALTLEGMGAAFILEGSANATAFELYVEQVQVPSLHAGQIVVMDNLQAHKSARVRTAIEAKGCQLLFLPSYSPDLTPLKKPFLSSKQPCDEQVPEPEKPWKKPLDKRYSPSPRRMHMGGFSIAGIFFLGKRGRANMVQVLSTPL